MMAAAKARVLQRLNARRQRQGEKEEEEEEERPLNRFTVVKTRPTRPV
jgi:hypothetical protein